MNIFRNLIGRVWHDPNAAEVVKISEGQLYLVREETIRSDRECIYNNAMATIRRVPSMEHNFQLVITRVYEEGDQELLEDEDETDEERVFLISEELEFRAGETEGEPSFIWRDIEGDYNEFYEFVASGTNAPTRAFFETCMYRAMYERKYRRSADNTTDADLAEFIWQEPVKKGRGKAVKGAAAHTRQRSITREPEPEPEPAPEPVETPSMSQATTAESEQSVDLEDDPRPEPIMPPPDPKFDPLITVEATLHPFNKETWKYDDMGEAIVQILTPSDADGAFEYYLAAYVKGDNILRHRIDSDMNQRWFKQANSLIWNYVSDQGFQSTWSVALIYEEDYQEFRELFTRVLWETLHQEPWTKAKADERAYVMSSNYEEDVVMRDVEDEEDDEDEVVDELDKEDDESEPEEEEYPEDEEDQPPTLGDGQKNSQLTVGYKGDRSYVVRGDKIGVFSHTGDQVKYYATINKVATPKGKSIAPSQVMLHDQDTKMVVMDKDSPHSLFQLDIERGKIVEEWKVNDNIPVKHIAPDNKFAQMTPEQTLVGASGNAIFRIDPRISGAKLVDSQYKQYVGKNKFSGVTTTASGKLAVASEKGDIRLFDSIGKNAKTALPPLGDPIIGIDVTANGRWVVATTKTYLLLIDTLIGEGRYTGQLGFDRSFPADAKPIPRRLQLRAEHVAYMGSGVSFSPARFNVGQDQEENAIVTSTGAYVVAWDFAKVKKGQLDKYEIKKYEDAVVQDNFKFGDDKEIIVAMENNVVAVNKKQLKRPTRASLAPAAAPRSRSSIVHAPY